MVTHTIIPVPERLRQEDFRFEASLGYTVRPSSRQNKREKSKEVREPLMLRPVEALPGRNE